MRSSEAKPSEVYRLGTHTFRSRLIIGTGKYASFEQNLACAEAAGAEMVTVARKLASMFFTVKAR